VLVGLVLLLRSTWALQRSEAILLGFAVILAGAVALIMWLRPGSDEDHTDDGAQV
jgi:hypothetical protein